MNNNNAKSSFDKISIDENFHKKTNTENDKEIFLYNIQNQNIDVLNKLNLLGEKPFIEKSTNSLDKNEHLDNTNLETPKLEVKKKDEYLNFKKAKFFSNKDSAILNTDVSNLRKINETSMFANLRNSPILSSSPIHLHHITNGQYSNLQNQLNKRDFFPHKPFEGENKINSLNMIKIKIPNHLTNKSNQTDKLLYLNTNANKYNSNKEIINLNFVNILNSKNPILNLGKFDKEILVKNKNMNLANNSVNNVNYNQLKKITSLNLDSENNNIINKINCMKDQIKERNYFKENSIEQPEIYCVADYAKKDEMNPRYRNYMEDFIKIIDKFNNNPKMGFFSLFDGHGGEDSAKYAKERIPELLAKNLITSSSATIEKCIINSFIKVDNELKFYDSENTGTTATVVFIYEKNLYLANVGDSKCVMVSDNGIKTLSYDHKCTDEKEIERVKKSKGKIINNRINGQLALSRALGDYSLKKYGVIPTPFTNKVEIEMNDKFIIIASDGVWDVTDENDINLIVNKSCLPYEICEFIIQHSILKGSRDNISCIVIKLIS